MRQMQPQRLQRQVQLRHEHAVGADQRLHGHRGGEVHGVGERLEVGQRAPPEWGRETKHRVGPEGWHHAAGPSAGAKQLVRLECVAGGIGGGEDFDAELLEQRARQKLGRRETLGDLIVNHRCRGARQLDADAEQLMKLVIEPHAGGCAAEQMEMFSLLQAQARVLIAAKKRWQEKSLPLLVRD